MVTLLPKLYSYTTYLTIISTIFTNAYKISSCYGTVHLQLHISTHSQAHAWLGAIQRVAARTNMEIATPGMEIPHAWNGNLPRVVIIIHSH